MITNAIYAGSTNTVVFIEPDNRNVLLDDQELLDWVAAGNTINPYVEPFDSAIEKKTSQINDYAHNLIEGAYSNPVQGIDTDSDKQRNVMSVRRNAKSDKLAGEIALSQEEKDEAKTDQKLTEFEIKIWADSGKATINLNKLGTVQEVYDFDIAAETWNVWTPPV